ncbi:hypothetical protein, partial [Draconibacterium sp.]|uniref:hypothetical protein n=1 Tax=Draconibacterium sp. TaxID=1965318 RepID=UPI003565B908
MKQLSICVFWVALFISCNIQNKNDVIDRKALVTRNNVLIESFDPLESLTVGNGEFAFTTDITGLQTFFLDYHNGVPLGTQSNWGWHTTPNTEGYEWSETLKYFEVEGRQVPYRHQISDDARKQAACNYFRENPHRLHLGIIGFLLTKESGENATIQDIKNPIHSLDMWTGKITSSFDFEGQPVKVEVYCHQDKDQVSAKIQSPLIATGQLAVQWKFPYAVPIHVHPGYDFQSPGKHKTEMLPAGENSVIFNRKLDDDNYKVSVNWQGDARFKKQAQHEFTLQPESGETLEFNCLFAPEANKSEPTSFEETKANNIQSWKAFWENGGVVDFSGCTDPRAKELERRTVLSQYLTKIQSSGSLSPQETGLTFNSWFGKYHLEMHWWHIAHFTQWQRQQLVEKQLDFYYEMHTKAKQTAADQGYKGIRWQKMLGPNHENSPSSVGSYLIWQQPHIIWFAEQMYRQNPSEEILNKYKKLVFETAEFMADFPVWNTELNRYDLAPPLIPAQEHWPRETTTNPPFELAYWYWGLTTAQTWKERLGEPKEEEWENVRLNLAAPDKNEDVYLGIQGATDSYTNPELMRDHPMVLGAYGILPQWNKVDPEIMRNTMHVVAKKW